VCRNRSDEQPRALLLDGRVEAGGASAPLQVHAAVVGHVPVHRHVRLLAREHLPRWAGEGVCGHASLSLDPVHCTL
jgi:hypothetical protein